MNDKKAAGKLRAFIGFYRPHRKLFALDLCCALFVALIDLAFPFVSRIMMNSFIPDRLYTAFLLVAAAMLASFLLRSLMMYVVTYLGHVMGVRMEADMRKELFTHLQKLSFSFYDKTRTGHLMSRVISDLFEITELAHHGPEDLFISLVTLVGAFLLMVRIHPLLAVIICTLIPIIMLLAMRGRKRLMDASRDVKERTAGVNASLESSISGIRVAKAFVNEAHEVRRFEHGNELYKHARTEYYRRLGFFLAGFDFYMALPTFTAIVAGGLFVMNGSLDMSELVVFTLYVTTFIAPIRRLANFMEQYALGMSGFERYLTLMRTEPDIEDAPGAVPLTNVKGDIAYNDVTFSYDDNKNVLAHVSLHVPAGSTLALVGPTGGGKSTLCHLLPRFYEINSGVITIDGKDIRSLTLASLRAHIGIVQQDVFLFAETIRENIRYGRVTATDQEVEEAAQRAQLHEEILALPNGYDTFVGERGVMLSGGQKQRVSIARLFLKNPPIVILDEATSALDTYTEHRIQASFELLSKGRTTLVIAHRLSTVKNVHKIVVIGDEGISESGTHAQLMAKNGDYARLYQAQLGAQPDAQPDV